MSLLSIKVYLLFVGLDEENITIIACLCHSFTCGHHR